MRDGDQEGFEYAATILTPRLLLRPARKGDQAALARLAGKAGNVPDLGAWPEDGAAGEAFIVAERAGGAVAGICGYGPMAERPALIEVTTWIAGPFCGRGLATEATQAIIDRAFRDVRTTVLWCANRVSDGRARRVIEKCGFQYRGTGMGRLPTSIGAVPVERFVLERRNWASLKSWGARPAADKNGAPHDNAA